MDKKDSIEPIKLVDGAVDMDKVLSLVFGDDLQELKALESNEILTKYNIDTKDLLKNFKSRVNNEIAKLEREEKPISKLLLSAAINLNSRDDI